VYRKRVVLFLLTDTHSATERQMVKMCVCACICRMTVLAWLALFLSWGSLGLETATVVVSIQATSSPKKTTTALRKRTSSTEYRHLCMNECVSSLRRGICVQPKLSECHFKFSKVIPAKMQSLIVSL